MIKYDKYGEIKYNINLKKYNIDLNIIFKYIIFKYIINFNYILIV